MKTLRAIFLDKLAKMGKKSKKQIVLLALKITGAMLVLLVAGFFLFRDVLLEKAINRISAKMERDYNSTFTVSSAGFEGLSGVRMQGITLVPQNADTLLTVAALNTSINISRLFTGDVQLGMLEMKDGYIHLVKNANGRNFDAFLKKQKQQEKKEAADEEPNLARRAYRLLSRALNLVPTDMALENLRLQMDDMGRTVTLDLKQLRLADKHLETTIAVWENDSSQTWKVTGFADPRNKQADLKFYNSDSVRIKVPYLERRYGLNAGFDSIHVNVANIDMDGDELHVDGSASIGNFMVNHARIAKKDVVINNASFDYNFVFGPDYIQLDSTSSVMLNKVKLKPYARYSVEKDTIYQLRGEIPKMKAQDFIASLPQGLFTNFEGMEAEGSFSYSLDFMYNKNKPSELVFDSSLEKEGLKIIKYGEADLAKLNRTFVYRAIDNGRQQRAVVVGPENPNFTPMGLIPDYLRKAVLTTEDPSFFSHRGFITEAFRQSIIKNIKTKQFTRGASTISMQLVKNVFLTRDKTLSRKLEEILLVYILENNRISSKERMLEVYFNVIEWGPDVYGIGEAAHFYFMKQPVTLSLDECLFLASIVPQPKRFMWKFNDEGNLKPYAERHNEYIKNLMLRRGLLAPEDTISGNPVRVTGPARSMLRLKEQPVIDSLQIKDFFSKFSKTPF